MQKRPFFSICIPCYNREKLVGETIQSVLSQDFDDYEIIVADNSSTDRSREVVRSFADERIRLLENRYNIGFAPNLQQVTQHARGRFLNLLSSDDLMEANALSTYAQLVAEHHDEATRLVLMSQAWEIDEQSRIQRYITRNGTGLEPIRVAVPDHETIDRQLLVEQFRGASVFATCMRSFVTAGVFCTVVYSRELWEAVEGYNSTQLTSPDKDFIFKVLKLDPTVLFVNRPLFSYRRHSAGQAAQQAAERVLKFQVDHYAYLMKCDDQWLQGTGVTQKQQQRVFVERDCIAAGLVDLAEGRWLEGTRLLGFAWASYPNVTLRVWKSWLLASLLLMGPLGIAAAWILRHLDRMVKNFRSRPDAREGLATTNLTASPDYS